MPEGCCDNWQWLSLLALALLLMLYELICFIGLLSLSIGVGVALKLSVGSLFDLNLHVAVETFCSWYTLACLTEIHLRLYKKCIYPRVAVSIRQHPNVLIGLPRVVYFLLYCLAIFGIFYEYEAYSYAFTSTVNNGNNSPAFQNPVKGHQHNRTTGHGSRPGSHQARGVQEEYQQEGTGGLSEEQLEKEKMATALFLMFMSYLIYASGQIISGFLLGINRGIPPTPACPQIYATLTQMVLQIILTVLYTLPLLMFLGACYCFHVDGDSTYMFSLCVAVSLAMAASHLELESLFPREGGQGPFYWFEALQRSRVNVIFILLFPVAYYFFQRAHSNPINARDVPFIRFTFWLMVALMHTIKTLYMTTAEPVLPAIVIENHQNNVHPLDNEQENGPPDERMRNLQPPAPPTIENRPPLPSILASSNNNNNGTSDDEDDENKKKRGWNEHAEKNSPSQNASKERLHELSISRNSNTSDHHFPTKTRSKAKDEDEHFLETVPAPDPGPVGQNAQPQGQPLENDSGVFSSSSTIDETRPPAKQVAESRAEQKSLMLTVEIDLGKDDRNPNHNETISIPQLKLHENSQANVQNNIKESEIKVVVK